MRTATDVGDVSTVVKARVGGRHVRELFSPGDRLGRYTVVRALGAGAFGQVFSAHDDNLKRQVALKVLYGEVDRERALRFHREGEALAALSHPNVVAVYDVFEHAGLLVLTMELVPGKTLADWGLGRPWREMAAMHLQAGRGLAAAHRAGLLHRDYKPENVLVGEDGRARVADFGLAGRSGSVLEAAAVASVPAGGDARLTAEGTVMGTPFFMAPEVRVGGKATEASDQYSFCRSLQDALDRCPDAGGDERAEGGVPPWLETVLARGLDRRPGARWPTMEALLDTVERNLSVRDELAPGRARHQRQLLLAGQLLMGVGAMAVATVVGGASALNARVLFGFALWQVVVTVVLLAVGRRALRGSVVMQRVSAIVALEVLAMLANRSLGLHLGLHGSEVLTLDLGQFCVVLLAGALFVQRWILWAALVTVAATAGAASMPTWAAHWFVAAFGGAVSMALWHLRNPSLVKPGLLVPE